MEERTTYIFTDLEAAVTIRGSAFGQLQVQVLWHNGFFKRRHRFERDLIVIES